MYIKYTRIKKSLFYTHVTQKRHQDVIGHSIKTMKSGRVLGLFFKTEFMEDQSDMVDERYISNNANLLRWPGRLLLTTKKNWSRQILFNLVY